MSKFLKMAASAALITGFAVSSANAGTSTVGAISNVTGDILVERNGEYLVAIDDSGIMAGDKVFATAGSTATLTKDDCVIDLTSNGVVSIGEAGDCSTVLMAQAAPSTEFALPSAISLNAAPATGVIVAVIATTVTGAIIIDELTSDDDEPTSP